MYSLIYFFIVLVCFIIIYIFVNYTTILIFNKGKRNFVLKPPTSYRLAKNYTYGNVLNSAVNGGDLNCSTSDNKLIECDVDPHNDLGRNSKCALCKQISSRCVNIKDNIYSASDPNVVLIPPNSSADKGYCLPSMTTSNRCTRRNGGKWILTQNQDSHDTDKNLVYTFECYCSTPNFFQNDVLQGNDCTTFVGCRHGKLDNDISWNSYEDMKCLCPANLFEATPGTANTPPSCALLNIYRRKYSASMPSPFEILDTRFIDRDYLVLLSGGGGVGGGSDFSLSLPNPCTFDVTTKKFIRDIGRVVFDETQTIAYCESTNSNYKTVVVNDDYLRGNGGRYANAMFRYRIHDDIDEYNDDADDNYNRYENAIVYEVLRKGSQIETLAGVRVPYYNFPIYLPYLEKDSFNMGNISGRRYNLHPVIPENRHRYAMVYIFDAIHPKYSATLVLGNILQYIPTFMSTSLDSRYRVYNGAIPCVNVPDIYGGGGSSVHRYRMMYPVPPATKFQSKLGKSGIMGELTSPNENSDKFTSTYGFSFVYNGTLEPYTELFTGTLFTYTINKQIYTRPVSCGDLVLTNKYRYNFDPRWRSQRPQVQGISNDALYQFAETDRDGHLFTRNSYDIERNEVGTTLQRISRYKFKNDGIEFLKFYS